MSADHDRNPAATPGAPDANRLLSQLRHAIAGGDWAVIVPLIRDHADAIAAHFGDWLSSPPPAGDAHGDGATAADYWNAMYVLAKAVDDNGLLTPPPGLFGRLVARGRGNPFARWERAIDRSIELVRGGDHAGAARSLSDFLIDVRDLRGFGYAHMTATTQWYLSQCHHALRHRAEAVGHAERSLAVTTEIGDHPKYVHRYLKHLWQVHRYFGEAGAAAGYAERLSDFLGAMPAAWGQAGEATFYRRQAELLRRPGGEPLTRVVASVDGAEHELADVPMTEGTRVDLAVFRTRATLLPAVQGIRAARAARDGADAALGLLRAAAEADPYAPEPHAEAGRILLAEGRWAEAADAYGRADELAPGWPGCRRGRWLAERLAEGRTDPAVTGAWIRADAAARGLVQGLGEGGGATDPGVVLTELVGQFPGDAYLHLRLGEYVRGAGEARLAEAIYRRGLSAAGSDDAADPETRTALSVGLALSVDDGPERRALLEATVALDGDLIAAAAAALALRGRAAAAEG